MTVLDSRGGLSPATPMGMHALYASAKALTELASVDEVLQSITQQARRFIDADLVYLTVDEAGKRLMRAVDGTFSDEFRTNQLQTGVGLAGLVESVLAPAWTANYFTDRRFKRSSRFDYLMKLEGIVALLAIPMLEEGELRGMLFVGHRSTRHFSPDEIAILSTFANHASISLRNARLYQRSQDAVAKLTHLQAELSETTASLQRANNVHDLITRTVLQGGGYGEVLAHLIDAVPGEAAIFNDVGQLVAKTPLSTITTLPLDTGERAALNTASARATYNHAADGVLSRTVDVVAAKERLGHLMHRSPTEAVVDDDYILERCGQIIAMLMTRNRAVVEARFRAKGELANEILRSAGPLGNEIIERARVGGIEVDSLESVIFIDPKLKAQIRRVLAVANSCPTPGGEVTYTRYRGSVVGLSSGNATSTADAVLSALAALGVTGSAVCVEPFDPSEPVAPQISRAWRIMQLARGLDLTDSVLSGGHLAPYATLFTTDQNADATQFIDYHLGDIIRHDSTHKTDLLRTVQVYVKNDGNLRRTADALYIHVNSLIKRLSRVDGILGKPWRSAPQSTLIALAAQLEYLRKALATPSSER